MNSCCSFYFSVQYLALYQAVMSAGNTFSCHYLNTNVQTHLLNREPDFLYYTEEYQPVLISDFTLRVLTKQILWFSVVVRPHCATSSWQTSGVYLTLSYTAADLHLTLPIRKFTLSLMFLLAPPTSIWSYSLDKIKTVDCRLIYVVSELTDCAVREARRQTQDSL